MRTYFLPARLSFRLLYSSPHQESLFVQTPRRGVCTKEGDKEYEERNTRHKTQDTRNKKQETRNKKQETRNKKQNPFRVGVAAGGAFAFA